MNDIKCVYIYIYIYIITNNNIYKYLKVILKQN